ncbi:Molybdate-binding protein ModA [Austwickia sp. TVS 96-490-7B]|uniref:molybdate ABC transporter substrate-binding protein n=1 Tax=Austwickia sp. TVS 96-490-7B TaxID=2830843 RepID=UPI001C57A38A|nr:molybdate ABC transporter substrate-binding protein [Austwickia sp. TVS 96-490-7B]MBW3086677.1 Molybdate-binding protein ModA [Austwickia sp. TVS 96-490-7B]
MTTAPLRGTPPHPAPRTSAAPLTGIVLAALALTSCSSDPTAATGDNPTRPVTVFAAASLKPAFTQIAHDHPNLKVTFTFDGSNSLVDQISAGAKADVLATADTTTMGTAHTKKLLGGPEKAFATNVLTLIVPRGNPAAITGLDQSLHGKKLVICAPAVPCGKATATLTRHLGVTLTPVSEENKVTDVRGKVESGEADAGIVYTTDAKNSGDKVHTLPIRDTDKAINIYPIALVADAPHPPDGQAFIDAVLSPKGQDVLKRYGFGTP